MIRSVLLALLAVGCLTKPERPGYDGTGATGRIAAGGKHACEIDPTTHLSCWGDNSHLELGAATALPATGSPVSDGSTGWTWVAAGATTTCAINDGVVSCWGDGTASTAPLELPNGATAAKVFAGGGASCAIDTTGDLSCWGAYDPATGMQSATPQSIAPGNAAGPWSRIAIADDHLCALANDGSLLCWGHNDTSQLGAAGNDVGLSQVQALPGSFASVAVAPGVTCATTRDGELECWGAVASGELGSATADSGPTVIDGGSAQPWTAVTASGLVDANGALVAGKNHACTITGGSIACWGDDDRGALGDGFAAHALEPGKTVLDFAIDVAAGDGFTCAVDRSDAAWCWGTNAYGELGNGEIATKWKPVQVTTENVTAVVATDGRTCALEGTTAYCWGDNRLGQATGDPSTPFIVRPQPGPGTTTAFTDVQLGTSHTCGLAAGTISCWGDNSSGQLGPNVVGNIGTIPPPSGQWSSLSAGGNATCGIDAPTGSVSCWGDVPNDPRQPASSTVVQLGYALAVSIGENLGLEVTGDSGNQAIGSFGIDCGTAYPYGAANTYDTFTTSKGWILPIASDHGCVETATFGGVSLECAGSDDVGQINGSVGNCLAATMVPSAPDGTWADPTNYPRRMAVGAGHTCAIAKLTTDSDAYGLYCWGANTAGELEDAPTSLGIATLVDNEPPGMQPLPGAPKGWSGVATGARHTCAIAYTQTTHGDGPLYCWGENRYGEVGDGTRFHEKPVAVAIPRN